MEYILVLTFLTATEKKATLTINNVKEDITETQISDLMDTIVTNNVFEHKKYGSYISKVSAELTTRTKTNYSFN